MIISSTKVVEVNGNVDPASLLVAMSTSRHIRRGFFEELSKLVEAKTHNVFD